MSISKMFLVCVNNARCLVAIETTKRKSFSSAIVAQPV